MATQAQDIATDTLKAQVQAWANDKLLGKTFRKEGLQARFTSASLERIFGAPHSQKYHQLLSLYDFERLLKQSTRYDGRKAKGWHHFQLDIYDLLPRGRLREEAEGKAFIYNIIESRQKNR